MSPTVRTADVRDADALAELNAVVQELHRAERGDFFVAVEPAAAASWFRETLESGRGRAWLAEDGTRPLGFVLVLPLTRPAGLFTAADAWWELDQIAVRPTDRRRGVARRLVETVLDAARREGVPRVEAATWEFNRAARETFAATGFSPRVRRWERRLAGGREDGFSGDSRGG
ncbi:MAG: GNAT family N-acetyltransferase [Planctomycetota bacterium]